MPDSAQPKRQALSAASLTQTAMRPNVEPPLLTMQRAKSTLSWRNDSPRSSKTNICGITVFPCDHILLLVFQVFRHPANNNQEVEVNHEYCWQSRCLYRLAVLGQWDKSPDSRRCSRFQYHEGRQFDSVRSEGVGFHRGYF